MFSLVRAYLGERVLRDTFVYTLAGALNAAIPFLILPVLTTYLTTTEYGIVSTFMVVNSIFLIIVGMEQHSYISVHFYEDTVKVARSRISNSVVTTLAMCVMVLTMVYIFQDSVENATRIDVKWILFAAIVACFQYLSQLSLSIWQLRTQPGRYGVYQVLSSLLNYGLSIFLIHVFAMGEAGRILGITAAAVIFGGYSFIFLASEQLLGWELDFKQVRSALIFCSPLVVHAFAGWINTGIDRLIINNYVGVGDTGVYSVFYQIGFVISLIASSFNKAFIPFIYRTLNDGSKEGKVKLVKLTYVYYAGLTLISLMLAGLLPFVLRLLVAEDFLRGSHITYWIILGFTADGFYFGVVNYLFYARKTFHVAAITFSSCVLHFAISLLLIPRVGIEGAAISTACSFIFSFILAFVISARKFPMPWTNPFSQTPKSSSS